MADRAAASHALQPPRGTFRHEVFLYDDEDEYLSVLSDFIRDSVDAGEPILVVLPTGRLSSLRSALPDLGGDVRFADMAQVGDNPGRIMGVWNDFLSGCDGAARGIGEPMFAGRDVDQVEECRRHERLLDMACAGRSFQLLCPYDAGALDSDVLEDARSVHPVVLKAGTRTPSPTYRVDDLVADVFEGPLPAPPATSREMAFGRQELALVRRFVGDQAAQIGLDGDSTADIVLAADEIATNYVVHGGPQATVRCWAEGSWFVCEIGGSGTIRDPLAGRIRPTSDQLGGRGLWLATQLCDLVQIRNTGDDTSVIRMRVRLP